MSDGGTLADALYFFRRAYLFIPESF